MLFLLKLKEIGLKVTHVVLKKDMDSLSDKVKGLS